jgi:hypothetical protein
MSNIAYEANPAKEWTFGEGRILARSRGAGLIFGAMASIG